jgi:hypothetical protein
MYLAKVRFARITAREVAEADVLTRMHVALDPMIYDEEYRVPTPLAEVVSRVAGHR